MIKLLHELITNNKFTVSLYKDIVKEYGLRKTWDELCFYLEENGIDTFERNVVGFYDIGRLYEIGLAVENKCSKKESGQYYTPQDVSLVMAKLLTEKTQLDNICDVACGCGNLIIEVLKIVKERSLEEFEQIKRKIYLYDNDELALQICVKRLCALLKFTKEDLNCLCFDFLNKKVSLPNNANVISNPPYAKINEINQNWKYKESITESKDLYVGFIEKIVRESKRAVIVTPQSYIVGKKFSKIRDTLNKRGGGEIYSFDNVPGTLFNGKKEGIFNTNTANGVRASIVLFSNEIKGYRLTHLIRFKTDQRTKVINKDYLKSKLGEIKQDLKRPLKCFKELEEFVYKINNNYQETLQSLISKSETDYPIYVNTSARYFIVASKRKLNRDGLLTLFAKDEDSFYKLYALLNSSYCYLWWRMLDGGILIPKSLILEIPLPNDFSLSEDTISFCKKLINNEAKYYVYKKNAGKMQESIKMPNDLRNRLNNVMFGKIDFSIVHRNFEEI